MNNELINKKDWLQRNWKWALTLIVIAFLSLALFLSQTSEHISDFGKAYFEPELYEGALKLAQQNEQVTELLGQLEPVGKMAILEGDIEFTNKNNHVDLSVRIAGTEGKANLSATAYRIKNNWEYEKITIRIKNPSEKRQNIIVK